MIVNDYTLDEVLDKIKKATGIAQFDDNKILIDTDDNLRDFNTLKNVVMTTTSVIKGDAKILSKYVFRRSIV